MSTTRKAKEPRAYPLDHGDGYCAIPRDAGFYQPLLKDRSGLLMRLWVMIHARARFRPGLAHLNGDLWLEAGQCALGYTKTGELLGVHGNTVRDGLIKLERLGLITRKSDSNGSVISIVRWGVYGKVMEESTDESRDKNSDESRNTGVSSGGEDLCTNKTGNGKTGKRKNGSICPSADGPPDATHIEMVSPEGPGAEEVGRVAHDTTEVEIVEPEPNGGATDGSGELVLTPYDPNEPERAPSAEKAIREGLARAVIGWLNGVHRAEGRQQHHRGFDPLAKDVDRAAKRWRKLKLKAEDVIAVCQQRIDGWKAAGVDWLSNARPAVLFRPEKFDAALEEWRSGFKHAPMEAATPWASARDPRRGAYEPSPETKYAGGVVRL